MLIARERIKRITALSLPVMGAMLSQNIINLVDIAMLSNLGVAAVAAAGTAGVAIWLFSTVLLSLSTGVQTISARRIGEKNDHQAADSLNTSIFLTLTAGSPYIILLFFVGPHILHFLISQGDEQVISMGTVYLQYLIVGLIFSALNYCFKGFWNGVNKPKIFFINILIIHSLNIFLNWVFIFGNLGAPEMGVKGAALASVISQALGTMINFAMALKFSSKFGFLKSKPNKEGINTLLKISVPDSIRQLLYSGSYMCLFYIIGRMGTQELAAGNVILKMALICYLPGMALGIAATTLVSQALGEQDQSDAKQWGYDVAKIGFLVLAGLSLPLIIFSDELLFFFLKDTSAVAIGSTAMKLMGISMAIEGIALVKMHSLIGTGATQKVMKISVLTQWLVYIPLCWILGLGVDLGLTGVYISNLVTQILLATFFALSWKKLEYLTVKV